MAQCFHHHQHFSASLHWRSPRPVSQRTDGPVPAAVTGGAPGSSAMFRALGSTVTLLGSWFRPTGLKLTALGLATLIVANVLPLFLEAPSLSLPYAALAGVLEPGGVALARPLREPAFAQTMAPADLRDLAFEWCAIQPAAREWMRELPITRATSATVDGSYHLGTRNVTIARPGIHVVLHEYAHANLHHKTAWQKAEVLVGMVWLLLDQTPRNQGARRVLLGVLAEGAQTMRQGRPYGLLHEAYAYLGHWSGGNLAALPAYLQPGYEDYLTAGSNHWLRWQAQQGAGQSY